MIAPRAGAATLLLLVACSSHVPTPARSLDEEWGFLDRQADVLKLESGTGALLVSPSLQGRVMTSALRRHGRGLGFVNRAVVEAPDPEEPFANYGGEDRFWIGPEGGPFALFFEGDAPRELEHWRVPEDLNRGAFEVVHADDAAVRMSRRMELRNARDSVFSLEVRRSVETLTGRQVEALFGALPADAEWVAFQTRNRVTHVGDEAWQRDSGLPCIWILGMFLPGERTRVIAPFRTDVAEAAAGRPVESSYFGEVPPDRLRYGSNFASFAADARLRSKIGVLRRRAVPVIGAWDPERRVLTVVHFGAVDASAPYVKETWPVDQEDPYDGDVANAYNHGGPEPFFELESSSPALALAPGESYEHIHTTLHLRTASSGALARFAGAALGVDWSEVVLVSGWQEGDGP